MNDNITPDHDGSPVPDTPASTTTQRRAMLAGMAGIAAGALLTRGAKAGPLNPPAGPVTSTGKTLLEIEPRRAINASNTPGNPFAVFRISQPGSYYLTANAFGEPSKRIIEIVTNNVTIDLNGFEVRGVAGGFEGIRAVLSATENIVVRNGIVRNASLGSPSTAAVDLSAVRSARVEDLIVAGSGTAGIETGPEGVVARCAARDCAGRGVFVGKSSLVERVLAVGNGADGIWTDDNTIVQDCVCEDNTMSGISVSPPVGFSTGSNCSVLNCIARGNGTFGVYGGNTCTIRDCSASNNGSNGFDVSNSCTITGAAARSNSANGIRVKMDAQSPHARRSRTPQVASWRTSPVSSRTARQAPTAAAASLSRMRHALFQTVSCGPTSLTAYASEPHAPSGTISARTTGPALPQRESSRSTFGTRSIRTPASATVEASGVTPD